MAECSPTFKQGLVDTAVVEGDSALLQVKVEGQPAPDVTWLYSEEEKGPFTEIQEEGRYEMENLEDGTCTLTINRSANEDIGFYCCRIKNCYGSEQCKPCELGVEPDPFAK